MSEIHDLPSAIIQQLQSLARSGVVDLPRGRPANEGLQKLPAPSENRPPREVELLPSTSNSAIEVAEVPAIVSDDERAAALHVLSDEVAGCTRCGELVQSRTRTVFGVGNVRPRLCFFGEAPGADEDAQGEPFVGRAGQLLNKIIAACKMKREDVYILNAIKCRPANNRTPYDTEIDNCWGYARRQLEILQPEFICCLGGVAVRSLLKRKESIGKLRQQFFEYSTSQVIVTYHPAYLLREPNAKRYVWEDMQMLMRAMGIPI